MALLQSTEAVMGQIPKRPDKPRPKKEQTLFSRRLLEIQSSFLLVNARGSLENLDSREQGCSEETEDRVYSSLRILTRPGRPSG